jgi:arginine repressor
LGCGVARKSRSNTQEKKMSHRILRSIALASSFTLAGVIAGPQSAWASQAQSRPSRAEHAIAGEIRKVDHGAKTLVIHTADGVDETVKFTGRTAVHGVQDVTRAADATAKAALEGGSVILYYTGPGLDKTAVAIDHVGTGTLRVAKGTVVRADAAGRFVIVKTAAGTEDTFELAKDAAVETGRGIEDAAAVTGGAIEKGAEVTVHYADKGGRKLAYLVKRV